MFFFMQGWTHNVRKTVNMTRDMWVMHNMKKWLWLSVYKCLNSFFLSRCGWPSHPVVGSRSFAYFLISLQRTTFIESDGCPCASNSTCFFMPVLPLPFHFGCNYEVSPASLLSPSESSVLEWVGYPWLHKPQFHIQFALTLLTRCGLWQRNINTHTICTIFSVTQVIWQTLPSSHLLEMKCMDVVLHVCLPNCLKHCTTALHGFCSALILIPLTSMKLNFRLAVNSDIYKSVPTSWLTLSMTLWTLLRPIERFLWFSRRCCEWN